MTDFATKLYDQRLKIVAFLKECREEAEQNEKEDRRPINERNWKYFYGDIDWSHKAKEDPKIHLHKTGIAAERTRSKLKQNLMNWDKWLAVERLYDNPEAVLTEYAAKNLVMSQFEACDAKTAISDAALRALHECRMTLGIFGKYVTKPRYVKEGGALVKKEKQVWQLDLPVIGFEHFSVDPFNKTDPLFKLYDTRLDYFRVLEMSSDKPTFSQPYMREAVEKLGFATKREQEYEEDQAEGRPNKLETNKRRKQVMVSHFYGTVLDDDGKVMEWTKEDGSTVPLKNVYFVVGNDDQVLMDPRNINRWSGRAPFVYTDPLRCPGQGAKALLDAGVDLNQADDELFNLMLEGALKSVHNVTWVKESWVKNKQSLSGGLKGSSALLINDSCPPGAVPVGVVQTGQVPQDAFIMQQLLDRAYAENVLSNQIDLSGNMPSKQVRATELVQASTAISDIFDSIAGDIEDSFIEWLGEEALFEIVQHLDDLDEDYVRSCFGPDQEKAEQFIAMSPQDRFAQVNGAFRFRGKGLRGLVANAAKAQALINYMNTLSANPLMMSAVETMVSIPKVAQLIGKGLGLDKEEIAPDAQERAMIEQKQLIREQALAQAELAGGQTAEAAAGSAPQPAPPGAPQPGGGQEGL